MAAPAPLVPCFYTTVKNISGVPRVFGFLGAHGKLLDVSEEYSERGDLRAKIVAGHKSRRYHHALERALAGFTAADGTVYPQSLAIKSSPSVVYYDTSAAVPKTITITGGALASADLCYGHAYTGLAAEGEDADDEGRKLPDKPDKDDKDDKHPLLDEKEDDKKPLGKHHEPHREHAEEHKGPKHHEAHREPVEEAKPKQDPPREVHRRSSS